MIEELLGLAQTPEEQKLVYSMVRRARAVDPRFGQAVGAVQHLVPPPTAPPSLAPPAPAPGTLEAINQVAERLDDLADAVRRFQRPTRILFMRDKEGRIIEATPEYT